jgi:hypothetical protein
VDATGATSASSRQVRIRELRPRLIVDAGPDISVRDGQLGSSAVPFQIDGKVTAQADSPHVTIQWVMVEPVYAWDSTDPIYYCPNPAAMGRPIYCDHPVLPNIPTVPTIDLDLLDQTRLPGGSSPSNPRMEVPLAKGAVSVLPLELVPAPLHLVLAYPAYSDYARNYRFRLIASDGEQTVIDEVRVRIFNAEYPLPNPPVIPASPTVEIRPVIGAKPFQPMVLAADVLYAYTNHSIQYLWWFQAPAGAIQANGDWISSGSGLVTYSSIKQQPSIQFTTVGRFDVSLQVTDPAFTPALTASASSRITVCDSSRAADLFIVADNSKSMWGQSLVNLESASLFLAQNLDPQLHQVGMASFGENAILELPLGPDFEAVGSRAKMSMTHSWTGPNGSFGLPGLSLAAQELFGRRRNPGALPVVLFITDGLLNDGLESAEFARTLHRAGVRVIVVLTWDLPTGTPEYELVRSMASSDDDLYIGASASVVGVFSSFLAGLCESGIAPPRVSLGEDRSILLGEAVALTATVSYPAGATPPTGQATYTWTQIAGSQAAVISPGPGGKATVSFPGTGAYRIRVDFMDGAGSTASDFVNITVRLDELRFTSVLVQYEYDTFQKSVSACGNALPAGASGTSVFIQPPPPPPPNLPPGSVDFCRPRDFGNPLCFKLSCYSPDCPTLQCTGPEPPYGYSNCKCRCAYHFGGLRWILPRGLLGQGIQGFAGLGTVASPFSPPGPQHQPAFLNCQDLSPNGFSPLRAHAWLIDYDVDAFGIARVRGVRAFNHLGELGIDTCFPNHSELFKNTLGPMR